MRHDPEVSVHGGGGFSPLLPGNFNDVDLAMKLASCGYQSYWTPNAELYHFESQSRDPRVALSEVREVFGRWEHEFWASDLWPTPPHELFHRGAAPMTGLDGVAHARRRLPSKSNSEVPQ